MNPDSMLVEPKHLADAMAGLLRLGLQKSFKQLHQEEPALAAFVGEKLAALVGKLALRGLSTKLVRQVHTESLLLILGSLDALQRGHRELWQDLELPPPEPGWNPEDDISF